MKVEAGAEGVFPLSRRGDVAFGADHRAQRAAGVAGRQAADLPANALERQVRGRQQAADLGGAGQHHDGRLGQHAAGPVDLPAVSLALQAQHLAVGLQADQRVLHQVPAQRRRVHPAGIGVEQTTGGQGDSGALLGFGLAQRQQQVGGESRGQFALAFAFLGVEGQLQHAAGIPVLAALQTFEQAPGVAETGDDQARQRCAMGRELEVEHALRIARGLAGDVVLAFQQGHPPAARGQAGCRGTAGQAGADDHGMAFGAGRLGTGEPGRYGLATGVLERPGEHLALVAETLDANHGKAGFDQPAADETGTGEGGQAGVGCGQPGQFGEQLRRPHLRVLRRGEAIEEPGVDLCVELRQAVEHVTDHQRQHHAAAVEQQALETRMNRPVLRQQRRGEGRQFRPQGQGTLQVGGAQREFLDADEMQAGIYRRVFGEGLPGAEKVQPGAEAGLADHQAAASRQGLAALADTVVGEEHVTGFLQAIGAGEVHVAVAA